MIDYSEKNDNPEASSAGQTAPNDSANDVLVHVMPEQFRSGGIGQGAKSTGLAILIGGILLLAVGGAAIYYFMFTAPAVPQPEASKPAETATTTKKDSEANPIKQVQSPSPATTVTPVLTPSSSAGEIATAKPTSTASAPSAASEAIVPSADSDRDGLTDEEEAVLGTDKDGQDSDGDSYGDLVELQRGYDPAGPGKLVSNSKIKSSAQKNFSILYPAAWTEKSAGGDYLLLWQAPDNQMVQVNTEVLSEPADIINWYKQRFNVSDVPADRIVTKNDDSGKLNWTGIKSGDGLAIYFLDSKNNELYTVSYNAGLDSVIKYPNLFRVMADSLTLK